MSMSLCIIPTHKLTGSKFARFLEPSAGAENQSVSWQYVEWAHTAALCFIQDRSVLTPNKQTSSRPGRISRQ